MTKVEYETNTAIACSCICFVKVIVKLLNINLHKATVIISFVDRFFPPLLQV